jgi:octaprenyl-diphosphate synthase
VAPAPAAATEWRGIIGPVEPFLDAVAQRLEDQVRSFEPEIAECAAYALTRQGKQLRPALVALSGSAAGEIGDAHVQVAVIIEMVHLATLVHDDVMDGAELRRGRPTLAANWGNEVSVLLGDCLFAQALRLAASFPTPEICRAVAAATNTVCAGEILQTQRFRKLHLSRDDYFKVVSMKTGELFALSCDLGAYLSGTQPACREALRQFGLAIGTAYQIYDDCVDLFGSESVAGKSLGTDLAQGKMTLPMLVVWERLNGAERAKVRAWVEEWHPAHWPRLQDLLRTHQALGESRRAIAQYLQTGREWLELVPPSEGRSSLLGLTHYFAQQIETLRS